MLECSAKDDINIKEIFRTFLTLSRILPPSGEDGSGGLKRRSSAYVRGGGRRRGQSPATGPSTSSANNSTDEAAGGSALVTHEAAKAKPRSRSLIRRSSRKAKQQMRDAHPDECNVS